MAMKWMGKLAGGLLGALTLGPLGAALGVLLGHQFDEQEPYDPRVAGPLPDPQAVSERFFRGTFRVMGCLAKSDGRVSEREISAARAVMDELRLAASQVQEAIACFTAGKRADFDLAAELAALRQVLHGRPDLSRIFLEIQVRAALSGNNMEGPVRALLARVGAALGVSALECAQIEAILRLQRGAHGADARHSAPSRDQALAQAYRVLQAEPTDSDAEVAKAYRRQLQRHHPDKLKANGLPESMLAHAKQRTQQIIEAWELVRERRGLR
ncbi:MAG: co-chaperone DjlA [Proteobacteria bacterium]|nr:co-chaperone DjlA [Pseudomonadota bacterium]